jgi:hypothetical protein
LRKLHLLGDLKRFLINYENVFSRLNKLEELRISELTAEGLEALKKFTNLKILVCPNPPTLEDARMFLIRK